MSTPYTFCDTTLPCRTESVHFFVPGCQESSVHFSTSSGAAEELQEPLPGTLAEDSRTWSRPSYRLVLTGLASLISNFKIGTSVRTFVS